MALTAAWASAPTVELTWKGERSRLSVTAPEGFEISRDAPADLTLDWSERSLSLVGSGAQVLDGLDLGALRGHAMEGTLALQLCDKASGVCTPGTYAFSGAVPTVKKGRMGLTVAEAHAAEEHGPAFNTDASSAADKAFETAKAEGELVVLDFSAVWCPPCNLLAAEVLHADDAETLLDGFQVAVLDVDHQSSWTLKDRYDIGSYPTVVIVDADGKEKGRQVGYGGRDAFVRFLDDARSGTDWATVDPSTLEPDEAARGLWALLNAGKEEGLETWNEAIASSDSLEAHLSRLVQEPSVEEVTWLTANAPESTPDWIFATGPWAESEEGQPAVEAAIRTALTHVDGAKAADLLYFAAGLGEEDTTLYAAAAATLKASFSGDDFVDRAHYGFLGRLLEKAGDIDGAVDFLDSQTRAHPDEPTFLLSAAGILNRAERHEEALERTKTALTRAWGDNKLRVAEAHCTALVGLDRAEEARGFADKSLHEAGPPDEGVKVRTHRYREKLAVFLETE